MINAEIKLLIMLAKRYLRADKEIRKKIQEQGINLIPENFYSNIPSLANIENSFEYRDTDSAPYNSPQVFNPEVMRGFMSVLSQYASEFEPPKEGDKENPQSFFWGNPAFSYSDAMSYYCVLRHFKPAQVLEIGSGFSTLVADQALKKNGNGSLILIEPYPKLFLRKLETVSSVHEKFVQDISIRMLIDLIEASDVWFIDSTHTVKIGSDCLYIYLKAMPEVKKDIIVHAHDIFLPFAFRKEWASDRQLYWTEQYLLYAYLLDNPKIEVLFGSTYANAFFPSELKSLMGGKYPCGGGSLWYRLNGTIERNMN
ncbi:MAG: class I SAM-dependent methyltransferase [Methylococcaceae bacterium]|nr:class I SAM-dependent methyltransferase [Methylococcaceae bacterium]